MPWSEERKARQREAIQRWRPWEKSTGPKTEEGKAKASANRRQALQAADIELANALARVKALRRGKAPAMA